MLSTSKRAYPMTSIGWVSDRLSCMVLHACRDWLARSTAELLAIAERLNQKEAGLQSLDKPWADTLTPSGRMVLTVFAGMAEFERALIRQRTQDGLVDPANAGSPSAVRVSFAVISRNWPSNSSSKRNPSAPSPKPSTFIPQQFIGVWKRDRVTERLFPFSSDSCVKARI